MSQTEPLHFESPDTGEEAARANLYALLASLFYAPPTQGLLDTIATTPEEGDGVLQQAWQQLATSCTHTNAPQAQEEYESLFISTGKPEVFLYGSYYLAGFLMEKPLAALRDDLAKLGLQRDERMQESEDHIAALCEVMRALIGSDEVAHFGMAAQKEFFRTHLQSWAMQLCDAIIAHPRANFYASTARLARSFFEVEMQAFDMA